MIDFSFCFAMLALYACLDWWDRLLWRAALEVGVLSKGRGGWGGGGGLM